MTNDPAIARRMEQVIKTYVKALNNADDSAIAACFCEGAVHYFANIPKIAGAATLATYFADSVRAGGISWTVDQMVTDVDFVKQCLNGRGSIQKGRATLAAWIGLSSNLGRSSFVRSAVTAGKAVQTRSARNSKALTILGGDTPWNFDP